jgi:hypothetical protein
MLIEKLRYGQYIYIVSTLIKIDSHSESKYNTYRLYTAHACSSLEGVCFREYFLEDGVAGRFAQTKATVLHEPSLFTANICLK